MVCMNDKCKVCMLVLPPEPLLGPDVVQRLGAVSAVVPVDDEASKYLGYFRCSACGAFGAKLRACSACHAARYCDEACQKADWRTHKKHCAKLAAPCT